MAYTFVDIHIEFEPHWDTGEPWPVGVACTIQMVDGEVQHVGALLDEADLRDFLTLLRRKIEEEHQRDLAELERLRKLVEEQKRGGQPDTP